MRRQRFLGSQGGEAIRFPHGVSSAPTAVRNGIQRTSEKSVQRGAERTFIQLAIAYGPEGG